MAALDTAQLLAELEPTVEDNLNRHLQMADEWMPHEYVPGKLNHVTPHSYFGWPRGWMVTLCSPSSGQCSTPASACPASW